MGRPGFSACIAFLAILFTPGLAQRPANASLCDYYAHSRYGANNSETQLKFIQNVVCLAFEGGTRLNNVSSEITGILRPGKFNGQNVDLQQFFNGSKQSTNVNNAAATVNWLDQGGTQPLAAFLAGESQTLNIANSSNQYRLFGNFFVAFSRAFGCTLPPPPPGTGNGPVSLAYAHKFMNLEYHQLGYFINHLALSAVHFGMSPQDADTFRTRLNSQYNVRCAPAVSFNPSSPPQLLSLCQNPTCPLAVPVSDCAAYNNLTANGIVDSKPTTVTNTATLTATPTGNAATGSSSPPPAAAPHSDKLSTGGIAGVAIGGAAVLLIAIIALIYFLRRRKSNAAPAPDHGPVSAWDQNNYGSPTIHPSSTYSPKNPHSSYYSTGQPASEMDTSRYQNLVDAASPVATPDPTAQQYRPYSGHPSDIYAPPPVEMDGTHRGSPPPVHNAIWSDQHRHSGVSTPVQSHEQYAQHEPWSAPHRQAGV